MSSDCVQRVMDCRICSESKKSPCLHAACLLNECIDNECLTDDDLVKLQKEMVLSLVYGAFPSLKGCSCFDSAGSC